MPRSTAYYHRRFALALLLALLSASAVGQTASQTARRTRDRGLSQRLDRILAAPESAGGFWGVYVYSLDRRRVLYNHNGEHWFTPASNAKLFTLAAALHRLGPDYRFHTAVEAAAAPDGDGVVAGDVIFRGVGDPSLSGRPYPYRLDPEPPALPYDPLLVPRRLAEQMQAHGVRHIRGNIVGDASYFSDDPYPAGWAIGDMIWDYGAPVSALTLNDNTRFLTVRPGAAAGDAAGVEFAPELNAPALDNGATTGPAGGGTALHLSADPRSGGLILRGHIAAGSAGVLEALAVRHPARLAAGLLRQALIERGIAVDGVAVARFTPSPAEAPSFELAGWDSPPLGQILQATAKVSQNLEAELMLRQLGKQSEGVGDSGEGEAAAGRRVRAAFLHDAGLGAEDTALQDGSGLSRQDLITPAGMVRLLSYMARQPEAAVWEGLLPIAGVDGTLEHRFVGSPGAGRIHAKTGSLSHVNSLSGYVTTRWGEHLAFCLLSNNDDHSAAAARAELDRLAGALLDTSGARR